LTFDELKLSFDTLLIKTYSLKNEAYLPFREKKTLSIKFLLDVLNVMERNILLKNGKRIAGLH
jgi:hypothetical protein